MKGRGSSCQVRDRRGAVLLEFALILPLFLLLLVGVLEFARAFNIWQVVVDAAREGARITALPPGSQSSEDLVRARVDTLLTSNGLDLANRHVDVGGISGDPGTPAVVTVEYDYTFQTFGGIVGWFGGSDPGTITLHSTSRMRNE